MRRTGYHALMRTSENHFNEMLQEVWGNLRPLLADPEIGEIMVNGPNIVWVEKQGLMHPIPMQFSTQAAWNLIQILACLGHQGPNAQAHGALLDVALPQLRVSVVRQPIAVRGHALCIRKHTHSSRPLTDYLASVPSGIRSDVVSGASNPAPDCASDQSARGFDTSQEDVSSALEILVPWIERRRNILVSGATSSGKTSFLSALLALLPAEERVITIEDTCELHMDQANCVVFEANESLSISLRDLVRQSLRFRPDRIVVGEVRGKEAFDLLQAMNTGHAGCMGTLHANSAEDALLRLEQMILLQGGQWPHAAIKQQIAACIDGVVHLHRSRGKRQIAQIIEIRGYRHGKYEIEQKKFS